MKLPSLKQQPVGEFASGNIPQPNKAAKYDAIGEVIGAIGKTYIAYETSKTVSQIDEATGSAANELSELRAKLENSNTLPADEVPDDVITELEVSVTDGVGGRREISKPFVFTHDIADEVWEKGSKEIVDHYASTIKNEKARAKFIGEMTERYIAPGTGAIIKANILRAKAFGQAQAERTVENIASSNAPTEVRETQMRETIARQVLLGADPVWAEIQLSAIGPKVDQIDVQNKILSATTTDQIDQIEETMWVADNRMSAEQLRTLSTQMDKRRADFKEARTERQRETAEQLFTAYVSSAIPPTELDIANAVASDRINWSQGWTFYNSMQSGSTTKASDPFMLSRMRGEIAKLQFTGNQSRVTDKADLLRLMITRGSMGLNPNGTPTGQPATISGEDVFKLNKDIDTAVNAALENDRYDNALKQVYAWTRVKVDISGQLTTAFQGNQNTVEAAIAFKLALDNYMDSYGADANPSDFFEDNKEAFSLNNFSSGIDGRFLEAVPQVSQFMTLGPAGKPEEFNQVQQENFILWLSGQSMPVAEYSQIITLFDQYYRGKGIAPDNGALMLEPDDPLYRQFQSMVPDNE